MINYIPEHEFEEVLTLYKGAYVQLWLFSVSRKRLVVKLSFNDKEEALYLIAVRCERIEGGFSWENGDVTLMYGQSEEKELVGFIDQKANFKLKCAGGIALVLSDENGLFKNFTDLESL